MSDELHQHKETPKDALLDALATCEIGDDWSEVVIIFRTKSGRTGNYDSGLTVAEAGWLTEQFQIWMACAGIGVVMGNLKESLFEHVGFEESPDAEKEGQDGSQS